ncbi:P1 family peptidase [Prosthecobacter sp. SYSU 5D2]|uniref:P1 family peptidase n=1 Tax=Prosthecobacter sp. SYSU 5D2 TaxID=3134134 RepID=UPI0031FE45F2
MKYFPSLLVVLTCAATCAWGGDQRARELGITPGVMRTGGLNAITDVPGLRVGQVTLMEGKDVRTGVTAILPHGGNVFLEKVPAAVHTGNGFGKLAGSTQIDELGNLESPIILTNTLAVGMAMSAVVEHHLKLEGMENVRSINAVVGETNDGGLNDIRSLPIRKEHVWQAITQAKDGPVAEGNVGAGTGTVAFGWKGGIGTSSRRLPASAGGFTVGVLVQSNFGGVLQIDGVPVDRVMNRHLMRDAYGSADGSCMIVVATNAPVDSRNLKRLASRAMLGLARTGGIASNGSGDYVIAFSTAEGLRIPHVKDGLLEAPAALMRNDTMTPLFLAAIEATEEAILNSLFMATDMKGHRGRQVQAMPVAEVMQIIQAHRPDQKAE